MTLATMCWCAWAHPQVAAIASRYVGLMTATGCAFLIAAGLKNLPVVTDYLSSSDVSIRVSEADNNWQPKIEVRPLTTRTLQITVTQQITDNTPLNVQVFPAHYWSEPDFKGLAPAMLMSSTNGVHTQTLNLASSGL